MKRIRSLHMHRWMLYYLVLVMLAMAVLWTLTYLGIAATLASTASSTALADGTAHGQLPWSDLKTYLLLLLAGGFLTGKYKQARGVIDGFKRSVAEFEALNGSRSNDR